jgi:glycosyltransferase involved in cell wall biosynthesis
LQFLEAAFASVQGGSVVLCTLESGDISQEKREREQSSFQHIRIEKDSPHLVRKIEKILKNISPFVAVGINTFSAFLLSNILKQKIFQDIPFWADMNGWIMAEMQAQAVVNRSNAFLSKGYEMEKNILIRADKVSTVSTPQKYAVLGELALLGRLRYENFHHRFVETIPNTQKIFEKDISSLKEENNKNIYKRNIQKQISQIRKQKDAFICAHIGGFNAWGDERTLFYSFQKAIKKNPNIHLFIIGGILKGIDEKSYPRFEKRVQKDKDIRKNIHFMGWLNAKDIPHVYEYIDTVINIDFDCPETQTGARNRLTEALKFGIPVLTTLGSEVSYQIIQAQAGIGIKSGNDESLCSALIELSERSDMRKKMSQNGKKLLQKAFSSEKIMSSFQSWLKAPKRSPDKGKILPFSGSRILNACKAGILYMQTRGMRAFFKKIREYIPF